MTEQSARRPTRGVRAALAAVVAAGLLSACTAPSLVEGSTVTVAVAQPFTSLHADTSLGRSSSTNAAVAALTGAAFASYDASYALVEDRSLGEATISAEDPLTIRFEVSPGARWSDGTAIDAADLLLSWAGNSAALNTPDFDDTPFVDPETGRYAEDFPEGVVFFDGRGGAGLREARQLPQFGDERTLFVHFESFQPAWQTLLAPTLPAHVVQELASGRSYDDPVEAKEDLVATLSGGDPAELAAVAAVWNRAYAVTETPEDPRLLISAGPYQVSDISETEVTLTANPEYRGDRRPTIETLRLRYSPDPLETVALLESGEVDVADFAPDVDVAAALAALDGVRVERGRESRVEHLDVQVADSRSGVFDDPRVREAFLRVLPRQAIVEALVAPLDPEAVPLDSFLLRPGAVGFDDAVAANGSAEFADVDLAGARALLADAGVSSARVCLLFDPRNAQRVAAFELIAASAAEVGFVVVSCASPDWEGLLGVAGAYDAALFAWDTTRIPPVAVGTPFRSDAALANFTRYASPEVDALLDDFERARDAAERAEIATQIDARLWADAYGAPLYAYPTLTAIRDTLEGVERSPLTGGVLATAWAWAPAAAG